MKNKILAILFCTFTSIGFSQATLEWKNIIGSIGNEEIKSTTTDVSGNIYTLGLFSGTVDFDPSAANNSLTSSVGIKDLFIAKYDGTGAYMWAVQIKSTVEILPSEIHIDKWNGVVYCGSFKGTVDFDPSPSATVNKTSKGGYDGFLARLKGDSSYDLINGYATTVGGAKDDFGISFGMVNSAQQIFFAGTFTDSMEVTDAFGNNPKKYIASGGKGIFMQKVFGNSGSPQYTAVIDGTNAITVEKMVVTDRQQVFITGKFNTKVDFDIDLDGPNGLESDTIHRYLNSGSLTTNTYLASYTYPGFGCKYVINLGANINVNSFMPGAFNGLNNPKYNLFVAGSFSGTADFDGTAGVVNLTSKGLQDGFIAKYDYDGKLIFTKDIGGSLDDVPTGLALDLDSNIYVTGTFSGSHVDLDPSATDSVIVNSNGAKDIFLAKYNHGGNLKWGNSIGGTSDDRTLTVNISTNKIILGGVFSSSKIDFDFSSGVKNATNAGGSDVFLAQYNFCAGLIDKNLILQTVYIEPVFNKSGAVYKWLNCGQGYKPIAGQTSQYFQPNGSAAYIDSTLKAGPYAVEITYLGCLDTSICINKFSVVKPVSNFKSDSLKVWVNQPIQFTDLSQNAPTTWNWSFPNSSTPTASVQNPTISYPNPGIYSVKLKASNTAGTDSITKVSYIKVEALPDVAFSFTQDSCNGNVFFIGTLPVPFTKCDWDFGDSAKLLNDTNSVSHIYGKQASFIVTYTAKCSFGTVTKKDTIQTITWSPKIVVVGNFNKDSLVEFSVQSSKKIKSYAWSFGDGYTSKGKAPLHTYDNKGKYIITVKLISPDTSCYVTISDTVVILYDNIKSISNNANVKVFPNPFTEELTLEINGIETEKVASIKLLDVTGREVYLSMPISKQQNKLMINLPTIESGIYFLQIQVSDEKYTFKVIRE